MRGWVALFVQCVFECFGIKLTGSVLIPLIVVILTKSTDPSSTLIPKNTQKHINDLVNFSATEAVLNTIISLNWTSCGSCSPL